MKNYRLVLRLENVKFRLSETFRERWPEEKSPVSYFVFLGGCAALKKQVFNQLKKGRNYIHEERPSW